MACRAGDAVPGSAVRRLRLAPGPAALRRSRGQAGGAGARPRVQARSRPPIATVGPACGCRMTSKGSTQSADERRLRRRRRGGRGAARGRGRRPRAARGDGRAAARPASRWRGSPARAVFCGLALRVDAGVYVPRWQSEPLALPRRRAAAGGRHRDRPLHRLRRDRPTLMAPRARARASWPPTSTRAPSPSRGPTASRPTTATCSPRCRAASRAASTSSGVVPYVPTPELPLLQRDTFTFETALAYDGGPDGLTILRASLADAPASCGPAARCCWSSAARSPSCSTPDLDRLGFSDVAVIADEDGDVRGIEDTLSGGSGGRQPPGGCPCLKRGLGGGRSTPDMDLPIALAGPTASTRPASRSACRFKR